METRLKVANALLYSDDGVMRSQILNPKKTNTRLIAALEYLVDKGEIIQLTALAPPTHHDDSMLNPDDPRHTGTHAGGVEEDGTPTGSFACDFWFLIRRIKNAWLDENDHRFAKGLTHCSQVPYLHQIGLAGAAINDENKHAAGVTVFVDEGEDHIHLGVA